MINNKMVISVFALCVMMHVVALMPHHHHKGDSVPCLNYSHIIHSHETLCDDHCDGHHEHDNAPLVACGSHKIVVTGPERPKFEISVSECDLPDDFALTASLREVMCRVSCDEVVRLFAEYRSGPDIPIPLMEYIVAATPSRAPDLTA